MSDWIDKLQEFIVNIITALAELLGKEAVDAVVAAISAALERTLT